MRSRKIRIIAWGLLALAFALMPVLLLGATVTNHLADVTYGQFGYAPKFIPDPRDFPQPDGEGRMVMDSPVTARMANGYFAILLTGGRYRVEFGNASRSINILVPPNDTNSYSLNFCAALARNAGNFLWTALPLAALQDIFEAELAATNAALRAYIDTIPSSTNSISSNEVYSVAAALDTARQPTNNYLTQIGGLSPSAFTFQMIYWNGSAWGLLGGSGAQPGFLGTGALGVPDWRDLGSLQLSELTSVAGSIAAAYALKTQLDNTNTAIRADFPLLIAGSNIVVVANGRTNTIHSTASGSGSGQTNWPANAITNAPWLTGLSNVSPSQISGGSLPGNVLVGSIWAAPVTNGLICFTHPQSGFSVSGTNISQWTDASGLTNHLYQTNAGQMPILLGQGDASIVHFPNDMYSWSNRCLYLPASATFDKQAVSVFIIADATMNFYNASLFQASGLVPALLLEDTTHSKQSLAVYSAGYGGSDLYGTINRSLYGMVCGANQTAVYRNERSAILPANAAGAVAGGVFGIFNGARAFSGNIRSILVYNRALSEDEVLAIRRWANRNFQTVAENAVVVCDGDSIVFGTASTLGCSWPSLLGVEGWRVVNKGIPSVNLETLKEYGTNVDNLFDPTISTNRHVDVQEAASNDFKLSGHDTNRVWTNWVAYMQDRRAAGWKTIGTTILPRESDATFETNRLGYNQMIREQWTNYCDGIADIGGDTLMGNFYTPTNTDYYADEIHPSNRGYEILANIFRSAIARVLGNTGTVALVGDGSGLTNLTAANITGVIPVANLGTGTPDGTKFLRDDGSFVAPSGGGDVTSAQLASATNVVYAASTNAAKAYTDAAVTVTAAGNNVMTGSNTVTGPVRFTGDVVVEGAFTIAGTNPVTRINDLVVTNSGTFSNVVATAGITGELDGNSTSAGRATNDSTGASITDQFAARPTSSTNVSATATIGAANGNSLTNLNGLQVNYQTNATAVFPNIDFSDRRSLIATNADFAWGGFANIPATNSGWSTRLVTNSSGSLIAATAPTGMRSAAGTWNITNVTAFSFYCEPGADGWTNAIAFPIW